MERAWKALACLPHGFDYFRRALVPSGINRRADGQGWNRVCLRKLQGTLEEGSQGMSTL